MSKKRSSEASETSKAKQPRHWSMGLLESMKNPELIVKETEKLVAIKDKYPKAKIHYLILPHENISGISKLNKSHIELLEEFKRLYMEFTVMHKEAGLRAGFHAVPSMQRLHMHVISTDMISPSLKTKIHWNSFTTDFFIPVDDIIKELKENGMLKPISKELHKSLMGTPLKCNQCSFEPKNMPNLKEHLLTHK
ncbi:hypothetical protein JYU34_021088 [Plutella xylostella]|uniref:HIT domain-containing protein n=1 Tax=Plutella xylostella TaxID=51655 RepID=A0ABQ7PSP3_PLUXY|nr:hypothetical protein JYU34_021088 [Plutella xylostella]